MTAMSRTSACALCRTLARADLTVRCAARELRFVEPTRLTLTFRPETGFYSHRLSVSGRYSHFRTYRTCPGGPKVRIGRAKEGDSASAVRRRNCEWLAAPLTPIAHMRTSCHGVEGELQAEGFGDLEDGGPGGVALLRQGLVEPVATHPHRRARIAASPPRPARDPRALARASRRRASRVCARSQHGRLSRAAWRGCH